MTQYTITVVTENYTNYTVEAESVAGAIHWAEVAANNAAEGDNTLPDGVEVKAWGFFSVRATHAFHDGNVVPMTNPPS